MAYPHSRPLIARLRASTRLVVMVLLVFLMKVGMVVACSANDFEAAGSDGTSTTSVLAVIVDDGPSEDSKSPDPVPHASCVDCHCHHAAALTPETASVASSVTDAEPAGLFVHRRLTSPRRELRPPIA